MASFLYRIGRGSFRRWPLVIGAWLAVLAVVGGLAGAFSAPAVSSFSIPGIPSERAQDLLTERFPSESDQDPQSAPTFKMVIATEDSSPLTSPENQENVARVLDSIRAIPGLAAPDAVGTLGLPAEAFEGSEPGDQPWVTAVGVQSDGLIEQSTGSGIDRAQAEKDAATLSPLSPDESVYSVQAGFDTETTPSAVDVTDEQRQALESVVAAGEDLGLEVAYNGNAAQDMGAIGFTSEIIGIVVALIVLAITFGSIVAAGLPIFTAIVGVGIAVLSVHALSGSIEVNDMTPILATMLGLAVAIDYSLFIASRYKHEIRLTEDRAHAAGRAVGTAGSAVVFAGLTVFIALVALTVVGIPFLSTMALAAAGAVVVSVLIALTLLPAVFGALKGNVFKGNVPKVTAPDPEDEGVNTAGERFAKAMRAKPWVGLAAGIVILALLAIPVGSMRLALPSDTTAEQGTPARDASDLLERGFGAGANAPLLAVIDATGIPAEERADAFQTAAADFRAMDGVVNAQVVLTNGDPADPLTADTAQILVSPSTGPTDEATEDLLHTMRDHAGQFTEETGANYGITGITAIQSDVSERLSDALVPYLAIVSGLAFLLLMLVFRSIVVPLTAALGFLLSVLATLGATVAIFQWGWFGMVEGNPLISFLPIMLIGLVFGLAMDYQVFLVSRMREAYSHGESASDAVVHGYKYGARVVSAAAVIMMSVFGGFILMDMAFIATMGFALAAAVFFDAFVVRMVIMPSLMYLIGDKAWWLPGWLDKILPKVDIEGENLAVDAPASAADPADERELVHTR
ncbi:MMPL family transporter [Rhodococcus sp. IEGM 1408]|uniref:MMPL family transporter n=1 Tax=Rhodococcus sp. IEGM 1408 TaxID=3082220 RepID=UPI0029545CA7|nr:MMPL family transporter [Rhodococcus sp. IEGM 1408]MDV8002301.1 MMPL family transporter [Rhodococcus sp. IEGM 1408]